MTTTAQLWGAKKGAGEIEPTSTGRQGDAERERARPLDGLKKKKVGAAERRGRERGLGRRVAREERAHHPDPEILPAVNSTHST